MPPQKKGQDQAKKITEKEKAKKYEELQGQIFAYCQRNNLHVLNTDMMNKAFLSNEANPTLFMATYLLNENNKGVDDFQQEEIIRLTGLLASSKKREEELLGENEELRRRFDALQRQHNKTNMNSTVRVQKFKNDTPIHMNNTAVALSTSAPQTYEQRQPKKSNLANLMLRQKNALAAKRPNISSADHNGGLKRPRLQLPTVEPTLSDSSSSSGDSLDNSDEENSAPTAKVKPVHVPASLPASAANLALSDDDDSSSNDDEDDESAVAVGEIKAVAAPPSAEASVSSNLHDSSSKAAVDNPADTSKIKSADENEMKSQEEPKVTESQTPSSREKEIEDVDLLGADELVLEIDVDDDIENCASSDYVDSSFKTKAVEVPPAVGKSVMKVDVVSSGKALDDKPADTPKVKQADTPKVNQADTSKVNQADTSKVNSVLSPPPGTSLVKDDVDSTSKAADDSADGADSADSAECADGADGDIEKDSQEEALAKEPQTSSHIKRANGDGEPFSVDDFEPDYEADDDGEF